MTHDMNLALKTRVSLNEKVVYPVSLFEHNLGDLFSVGALV